MHTDRTDRTDRTDFCSRRDAYRGLNTIFLNTNNPNDTNNFLHADFYSVFYTHTDRTDIVRGGALTGGLNTRFFEHE